jgi:hypothetical protein
MATPVYYSGWGPHSGVIGPQGGPGRGGLSLSGNTPAYFGTGQPVSDAPGWFSGWFSSNGTPVYLTVPAPGKPSRMPPSVTMNAATASPPAPQPGQVAIVVPRS